MLNMHLGVILWSFFLHSAPGASESLIMAGLGILTAYLTRPSATTSFVAHKLAIARCRRLANWEKARGVDWLTSLASILAHLSRSAT